MTRRRKYSVSALLLIAIIVNATGPLDNDVLSNDIKSPVADTVLVTEKLTPSVHVESMISSTDFASRTITQAMENGLLDHQALREIHDYQASQRIALNEWLPTITVTETLALQDAILDQLNDWADEQGIDLEYYYA